MDACEAGLAGASVTVNIVGTGASIPAGGTLTLIDLHSATRVCEARQTAALEAVHAICARASIQARI